MSQPESNEVTTDVKGKGKGKGKGKSSQIVKPKSDGDNDVELTTEVHPEPSKEAKISPNKKAKSAAELYQNLVNDEVMEEESSDDDDDEDAFGELDSDSDSDEDEDSDVELEKEPIGSEDDTEELPSSDDTPDTDEEEDDDDDGELIGGDFNEEVSTQFGLKYICTLKIRISLFAVIIIRGSIFEVKSEFFGLIWLADVYSQPKKYLLFTSHPWMRCRLT